jgi:methionyl-tRNA formyltransferase
MAVEEGLDTGGVHARAEVPIAPDATADSLRAELVAVGVPLLIDTLERGLGEPEPQRGEATYAAKIDPAELRIDWSRPPIELDRLVRVGDAWTTFRGSRVKVHGGRVEGDRLLPTLVQPEGKPRIDFDAWRNGARMAPDEWFE